MKEGIVVRLKPVAGKFDLVADKVDAMLVHTRSHAECVSAFLCRDRENNELTICQLWTDAEAHATYLVNRADNSDFDPFDTLLETEMDYGAFPVAH